MPGTRNCEYVDSISYGSGISVTFPGALRIQGRLLGPLKKRSPLSGEGGGTEASALGASFYILGRTPHVAACMVNADQKSSVRNPQNTTLTSSTDHSEVFSQNSLPSHTACAIIVDSRCWTGDFRTIAPTAGISCSARVTHRLNLLRPATARIDNGDSPSACS